ncbi:RING finger protein 11-like [Ranitomeya variabilis]|uniref:RING finger protein 11-like n=1 Tax=Ranitomeya variabilis TaxID=490064 RepID=UPI0040575DC3
MSARELRQLIADNEAWLRRPENQGQAIIVHRLRSHQRDQERPSTSDGHQRDSNAVTERRRRTIRDPPRRRGQEERRERSRSPLRPAPAEPSRTTGESSRGGDRPLPSIQQQEVGVITPPVPQVAPPAPNLSVPGRQLIRLSSRVNIILPTRDVTPEEETQSCVICMTEYEIGEQVIVLPCDHSFHQDCISRWLHYNPLCPLCRYQFFH